ncbi:MAG: hypothetical protein AAGC74_12065 [Verrucomicrobiota bacterium]
MKSVVYFSVVGMSVVVIFCAGIWVGKVTSPESLTVEEVRRYARLEVGEEAMGKRLPLLEALQRYTRILGLSEEQRRELYPLFAEASRKIRRFPPLSVERLKVIEGLHERLSPHLTERQQELAKEILEDARSQRRR